MNTQPETRIEATSRHGSPPLIKPQRWARLYGGLYVINIVGSSFAFGYLDALVMPGDAAATTFSENYNGSPPDAISRCKSAPCSEECAKSERSCWKRPRRFGRKK